MLRWGKITHKNLIDSSPLFPCSKEKAMYNLHLNDILLLGQSKGKIKVYAPYVERFFIKDRDQKKKSDSRNRWMGSMMRVCCNLLHALFSLQTGL